MAIGITLNAIISILATASRVSLAFAISNTMGPIKWLWLKTSEPKLLSDLQSLDSASRGPAGSLGLLSTHLRWSVASIGAIVTLLMLLFDPFVQQVVRFEHRVVYSPSDQVAAVKTVDPHW